MRVKHLFWLMFAIIVLYLDIKIIYKWIEGVDVSTILLIFGILALVGTASVTIIFGSMWLHENWNKKILPENFKLKNN